MTLRGKGESVNPRPGRIGFLRRERIHCRGRESADRQILTVVVDNLRARGAVLDEIDPVRLQDSDLRDYCAVLSMASP